MGSGEAAPPQPVSFRLCPARSPSHPIALGPPLRSKTERPIIAVSGRILLMNAIGLDTHAYVKRMTATGMAEAQAEVVTALIREAQQISTSDLATKADLAQATTVLRTEIAQVTTELRAEIAQTTADLRAEIAQSTVDLRAEIAQVSTDLRAEITQTRSNLRDQIAATNTRITTEMAETRASVKVEIAEAKADILKWMVGMIFGAVLINAGVVLGGMLGLAKLLQP
ncbi:Hypothetical phage protein [Pararhodospirillum photometricum DSM 122]|uniref:Hypothetical phage protein n=2 Tax=Pararhodospirillum photometricum TaxID=1084 RepID=H6SPY8_PARPM|nr:Hypothetical phage protein [Pararhodospirillum photometricum DSM 122]